MGMCIRKDCGYMLEKPPHSSGTDSTFSPSIKTTNDCISNRAIPHYGLRLRANA